MTDDNKARRKAEREQRLQSALRDNLRRRKAQARGRAAETPSQQAHEPDAQNSGGGAQKEN